MDLVTIEILLWLGFALMLWALKDSLQDIESQIRDFHTPLSAHGAVRRELIATPQNLLEPMGRYLDQMIYRYAVIDGRHYCFDHVCPASMPVRLKDNQRWIAPGLVYVEAAVPVR